MSPSASIAYFVYTRNTKYAGVYSLRWFRPSVLSSVRQLTLFITKFYFEVFDYL